MREFIQDWLEFMGISMLVIVVWVVLEVIIIGKPRTSRVDDVIGIILTTSLFINLKLWDKLSDKE